MTYRHNTVQNALQSVAHQALGSTAFHVQRQPWIVPKGTLDTNGRAVDGLQADLGLRGILPLRERTMVDVRVSYPDPPVSATNQNTGRQGQAAAAAGGEGSSSSSRASRAHAAQRLLSARELIERQAKQLEAQEAQKERKYHAECERQGLHFVPFVLTPDGALGPSAQKLVRELAELLSGKWRRPKGVVMGWIRARLAMAVARASSACIRGNRSQPRRGRDELEVGFGDGAALAPLLDCGGGVAASQQE